MVGPPTSSVTALIRGAVGIQVREGQEKLTLDCRGLHAARTRLLTFLPKIRHHGDGDDVGYGESRMIAAGRLTPPPAAWARFPTIAASTGVTIDSFRIMPTFWSWISKSMAGKGDTLGCGRGFSRSWLDRF